MATAAEMYALAMQYHQAGHLPQAEQLYRQILQFDPYHADSHHLLGVLDYQCGRNEQAMASIRHAISLKPAIASYYSNLGLVYQALDKLEDAAAAYEQVLSLDPASAEAHGVLGNLLAKLGRVDEAIAHCRQAIQARPGFAGAHNNLGLALAQQGKWDEAVAQYQLAVRFDQNYAAAYNNLAIALFEQGKFEEAIASFRQTVWLNPKFADAYHGLGLALDRQGKLEEAISCFQQAMYLNPNFLRACNNLGVALMKQGRSEDAKATFRRAIQVQHDHLDAYYNLGSVLMEQGLLDEAVACYEQVLRLKPDYAEVLYNLGNALMRLDRLDEACRAYQRALQHQPEQAATWNNLGTAQKKQARYDEALDCFDHALRLDPDFAQAHWNRAVVLLLRGDFEQGWPEYEWRWLQPWLNNEAPGARRTFAQPLWDGGDLAGQTILLYAEQGLGDTLHFIRFAPLVRARGGKVMVQCQTPLLPLLTKIEGIDRLVGHDAPLPAFEVQAPLLGLPGIFSTGHASPVPAIIPYIHANARLVENWRQELCGVQNTCGVRSAACGVKNTESYAALRTSHLARVFRVGIAWQGNPAFIDDGQRSIPLAQFQPLMRLPDIHCISLQMGPGINQLGDFATSNLVDFGDRLDRFTGAFMDTAAVMMNLDLVITSDTAIAHLAGALGVPVWVALAFVPDWRWMLEREDSLWYSTMRLFRQRHSGKWEDVFDDMAKELTRIAVGKKNGKVHVTLGDGSHLAGTTQH